MRSPALAIAWEFRRRHRWPFAALIGYLVLMTTTDLLIVPPGQVYLDADNVPTIAPRFVATVLVPLCLFSYYLMAAFSFGLSGSLATRESLYPARLFALPVTTTALAGWPMLYGSATMAGLFVATTMFAVWPSGVDLPLIWPTLFAVASLAWIQVLMWMPYGLPGLRVAAAVAWLAMIDAVVFTAIGRQVPEPVMIAFLAPQLPLAFLCARFAVARARRGDVPDWRDTFARHGATMASVLPRRGPTFPSAGCAQAWFEWQLHGRTLPVWVAILLPCELALLFVAATGTPSLVAYTLFGALVTPPFLAAFVAPRLQQSGLSPFISTRPLTSAALIAAKVRMTIGSTLATWLLVLVAIPAGLTASGTWPVVTEWARRFSDAVGTPRAIVVLLLAIAGLVASTWKQLVQGLFVGVSGRQWLLRTSTVLTLTFLIFIEPIIHWFRGSADVRVALWNGLPWILAALVGVKLCAAGWVATRLYERRLCSDRTLVTGAACWLVAVLALYGAFVWLFSTPFVPRYKLALVAILAIPLARVSAAPLALAWNRHR